MSRLVAWQLVALVSLCLWLTLCGDALAKRLAERLVFEGKVQYPVTRVVRNAYDGEMQDVLVHDSQSVKNGDVLGRYTLSEYTRGQLQQRIATTLLQQKEMALDEARTKLRGLQREQASLVQMYDEGMASQAALETATERVEDRLAQIAFLEQVVSREKKRLDREKRNISEELGGARIRSGEIPSMVDIPAPLDGTVIWMVDEKDWALRGNSACFKVADMTKVVLMAKVFVEDYPKLAKGMVATVTAKGQAGRKLKAILSKLPLTPIDKGFSALSYYQVEFEMDNPERLFREGYRVRIELPPQAVEDQSTTPAS